MIRIAQRECELVAGLAQLDRRLAWTGPPRMLNAHDRPIRWFGRRST